MRMFKGFVLGMIILTVIAVGCSQGSSPVDPAIGEIVETKAINSNDSHNLWGLFTFICNPESGTIDIRTLRDAQLHLNALKFLEPPPLVYLTLESPPQFNGNILDVDIGLRNPYLGLDQFTGFDVCGIIFTHGSYSGFHDPDIVIAGEGDTRLLNADGHTRWWNPVEFPHGDTIFNYKDGLLGNPAGSADFNCTINGYKYFADGLEKDEPLQTLDPDERGAFTAGQKNVRHYEIDITGGLVFNYAVDANWKQPSGDPPYDIPDDFPPGANRPEAYNSTFIVLAVDLFYNEYTGEAGGSLTLRVNVYDHSNVTLNEVHAESLAGLPYTTAFGPYGDSDEFSTYAMEIPGDDLTQNGEIEILITVESEVTDYGGILPGKPVCIYFMKPLYISEGEIGDGWARTWGGSGSGMEYGLSVAVDDDGYSYVSGTTHGEVDFDPGPGVDMQNNGSSFVSKFDADGLFQWARSWDAQWAWGVDVNSQGNAYITGGFNGVYLRMYDTEGEFQWEHEWDGGLGLRVTIDELDNIIITGMCPNYFDSDPGPEVDPQGEGYMYVVKFDSDGEYLWGQTFGTGYPYGLCSYGSDCIYVAGYYDGNDVDFNPGPDVEEYSSNDYLDVFLTKWDSDGNYQWTKTWGGEGDDICYRVITDDAGGVYLVGWFTGEVDFDPGPGECVAISNGGRDSFIMKIDQGEDFQWVKTWGGDYIPDNEYDYDDFCTGLSLDTSGDIYVSGTFASTVDFDPGPGISEHTAIGYTDIYLLKLNPSGEFIWVRAWGGTGHDQGWGGAVSTSGDAFVTGCFSGTVDFNPNPWVNEHTSNGGFDVFLSKFPPDGWW